MLLPKIKGRRRPRSLFFPKVISDIMVVQPGQDWDSDNGAGPLDCPTCGRVFAKRQVRAHLIVVRRIRRKNLPQVRLAEDQHPVQALAPHGTNQTLYIRILPRRSRRDRSVADAHRPNPGREGMSVGTGPSSTPYFGRGSGHSQTAWEDFLSR